MRKKFTNFAKKMKMMIWEHTMETRHNNNNNYVHRLFQLLILSAPYYVMLLGLHDK